MEPTRAVPPGPSATPPSDRDQVKVEAATLGTTPAGGQVNADWGQLREGIACLAVFLAAAAPPEKASASPSSEARPREWHVVFRCGTVARVAEADAEFMGYEQSGYRFPDHRLEGFEDLKGEESMASTVEAILADNAKVWEAQKAFPGEVGRAARRAYTRLVAQGYPYPGASAARSPVFTGLSSAAADAGPLWMVLWPGLDTKGRMYNLAFASKGERACHLGGELRRYDYMFPEVAAVITPELAVWTYGTGGRFSDQNEL
jgi:hypothetical protein